MASRVSEAFRVLVGRSVAVPSSPTGGVRVVDDPADQPGAVRVCDRFWVARVPCQHCGALEGQYHRPDDPTDTRGVEWERLEARRCSECGLELRRKGYDWLLSPYSACPACGGEMVVTPTDGGTDE